LGASATPPATLRLVVPARETVGLVRYLQKLGTSRGIWRDVFPPQNPAVTAVQISGAQDAVARGRAVYERRCIGCHGARGGGKGDGPSAAQLRDDFERPIRPTDFTRGQFKAGATVSDVFRGLTLGLDGTPMPSFADALTDDERWAIAYYVLSLSAWADPLTGERLDLPQATRR